MTLCSQKTALVKGTSLANALRQPREDLYQLKGLQISFMKLIIALLLLIGIASFFYNNLDKRLYYIGRNDFERNGLPLGIQPEFRPVFEGGFGLRDRYGFSIAAKGNAYNSGDEEVLIEKSLVTVGVKTD